MILITGYKGFIGSHLKLTDEYVGIDIRDGYNLLSCDLPEVDTIIHLAAQTSVEGSWHDPMHDMDNLKMTARLIHKYPNAKLIYASSCAVMDVQSPYGFSKKAAADYIKTFHKNYVICVFPNVFGIGGKSVIEAFKGKDKVTVYGDGHQTRDFVHVEDIARGLLMAQNWPVGEYFMGSGTSHSVLELARGKEIIFAPARKEMYEVNVPNTTPDWKPLVDVMKYICE